MVNKEVTAVILTGGLGTRLRPYTLSMPKPMLPLGDKPILEHIIEWLKHNSIKKIIISLGYMGRIIEEYFQDGKDLDVEIKYVKTRRPMGTAGQLKAVEKLLKDTFLCVYGDAIIDCKINEVLKNHYDNNATVSIALIKYKESLKYGFIEINNKNKVLNWNEKPEYSGLINIGCYIMEPKFLQYIPKKTIYEMDNAVKNAIKAKDKVYGNIITSNFIDIGDKKSYDSIYEKYLSKLGKIG